MIRDGDCCECELKCEIVRLKYLTLMCLIMVSCAIAMMGVVLDRQVKLLEIRDIIDAVVDEGDSSHVGDTLSGVLRELRESGG